MDTVDNVESVDSVDNVNIVDNVNSVRSVNNVTKRVGQWAKSAKHVRGVIKYEGDQVAVVLGRKGG